MADMPRQRPPHVVRQISRHGKIKWFYREYPGPRIRLPDDYGTAEFWAAYEAAHGGRPIVAPSSTTAPTTPNTLGWLLAEYRAKSDEWAALRKATRRQRDNIFAGVLKTAGGVPFQAVSEAKIVEGREARKATPHQARNFLDAMRGLFRWAKARGLVAVDPTASVGNPKRPRQEADGGFVPWSETDMVNYDTRWPLGTKERVWRDVIAYTGLRRGDAVRVGKQHIGRDGRIHLTTEKTGEAVTLPILPVLRATLDAGPIGELTFICGARGLPYVKESFGTQFRKACDAAGVKGSAHGIRKIAAMRAALNGATVPQLNAIFGWRGSAMASLYTAAAERSHLSAGAIDKLLRELPEPVSGDAAEAQKSNIYPLTPSKR
jgi:integrase